MTSSNRNAPHNPARRVAVDDEPKRPAIPIGDDLLVDRGALQLFARNHHIRSVSLFGSTARGDATPESDVDLLIEFESGKTPSLGTLVQLQDELSRLFGGRRIDVATPAILRNPYRRQAIEQEIRTLYAA